MFVIVFFFCLALLFSTFGLRPRIIHIDTLFLDGYRISGDNDTGFF